MNFKPVDECYEDDLHNLMTVKWSSLENAHFTVPDKEGIAYNDGAIVYAALVAIVYAALVAVEQPEEVVYDSIWKYAPDKTYHFAVLEKNAFLRYFHQKPRRMPDGSYTVNEQFQMSSIYNNWYCIKNAKLNLDPNYEPGTLVERSMEES